MFLEYQVDAVSMTFRFMSGPSNTASFTPIPELLIHKDPFGAGPGTIAVTLAYEDNIRQQLSAEKQVTVWCVPKPNTQMYQSAIATSYAYDASARDLWFDTLAASTPFYVASGFIRNFDATAGSGANIMISTKAFITCRRSR
jgi:hypothetical protein